MDAEEGEERHASSMGNISFFFPKAKQGSALGINGGLGNLGVSVEAKFAPAKPHSSAITINTQNGVAIFWIATPSQILFPKAKQGSALGINGGLGNLGVSVMQMVAPAVISPRQNHTAAQ
jgi:nitrate/nitrite transporter NarK